ncbi:MAG: UDP-2,4-diacetamido-2,4,6-trideoxy-beta-L-altropyranose hydrolase [Lachnospiraceae bacterium]|nr:UDP-2,4-diacetamido-2,4,6-trideoxy-beta-L-altropyranose hydrolase [Lachnospiraceae bacterium]
MIVFRADGNDKVGYGHVFRCLSIADAFSEMGEKCIFLLAGTDMKAFVESRGHETRILQSSYQELEGELDQLKKILHDLQPKLLVIDSYYVTEHYLKALQEVVNTVYLDDLAAFAYPVGLLINYNVYGPYMDYKSLYEKANVALPELMLGPEYVPLRKQCQGLPRRTVEAEVKNVLISTGGTDPLHVSLSLLKHIEGMGQGTDPHHYHFLVGNGNPDREELLQLAQKQENVTIHYNIPEVTSLFLKCDLAISASGSTLYELCACGTPTITYAMADNQLPGNRAFKDLGLMESVGDLRGVEHLEEVLWHALEMLSSDLEKRINYSQRMQAIVDGHGAERLAKRMFEL